MTKFDAVVKELAKDPEGWQRVQKELSESKAEDRPGRLVELAKEKGLELDAAEVATLVRTAAGELGENELESVAGGFNPQPEPPALAYKIRPPEQVLIGLLLPAVQKVR